MVAKHYCFDVNLQLLGTLGELVGEFCSASSFIYRVKCSTNNHLFAGDLCSVAQPCRDARGGKRRDIVALKLSVSSIRGGETVSLPFYSVTDLAAGPIISVGLSRFRREIGAHHLPLTGVRRMLSEDARPRTRSFLLIAQSARIVTSCPVPAALRVFQHLAGFYYHK